MMNEGKQMKSRALALNDERLFAQAFWVFTFAILVAAGAQIEIPVQPVPFTLQTFFVLLAGALLGKRMATLSMGLYLVLGICGLPVFAGGALGVAKIVGPTGGYLLAFPIAAYVIGTLVALRKEYWWMLVSMFLGSAVIFAFGTIQLNLVYLHNWSNALRSGALIFSIWDVVKIIGAATIAQSYRRYIRES